MYNLMISLFNRSLALPIGRGMLTIASLEPLMAEALPIPPVSLQGRLAPHNHLVTLDVSQSSVDITLWSDFHNGVSAALRVGPKNDLSDKCSESSEEKDNKSGLQRITRNWIIYNKTAALGRTGGEKGHAGKLVFYIAWSIRLISKSLSLFLSRVCHAQAFCWVSVSSDT